MSKSFKNDLTGKRFGRLTVLEFVPNKKRHSHWKCRCDCGNTCIIDGERLKINKTSSCGCFGKEQSKIRAAKHNKYGTRLYNIWGEMLARCYNDKIPIYIHYGGRNITVCDEWKNDFMSFYGWSMANGYDDVLTIDRIDVNGNYCPKNCRWVDMKTQQRNRRNNIIVEYEGNKMTLAEATEKSEIKYRTLYKRYRKGDRGERLFRPLKSK